MTFSFAGLNDQGGIVAAASLPEPEQQMRLADGIPVSTYCAKQEHHLTQVPNSTLFKAGCATAGAVDMHEDAPSV
jgi:hypothetical protein